ADADAGRRVRSYILDVQLAADAVAGSLEAIATDRPELMGRAATVAAALVARRYDVAAQLAELLSNGDGDLPDAASHPRSGTSAAVHETPRGAIPPSDRPTPETPPPAADSTNWWPVYRLRE